MRRRLLSSAFAGAAVMCVATARGDLVNGSFEVPVNPPAPGTFITLSVSTEAAFGFTGWRVSTGDVDVVDLSAPVLGINWTASLIDGPQVLDLNGIAGIGGIFQDLATTPGTAYTLSFSYSDNPLGTAAPAGATVSVLNQSTLATVASTVITHTTATLTSPDWSSLSLPFIAGDTTTRVVFQSTTSGADSIILDAVSVPTPAAVPEPSALCLTVLCLGAAGVVSSRRRRSRS
jgi:Protein of unknown function (DUF642)/PEP-CTERM motif